MKAFDLVIENAAILTMDANETIIKNGTIGVKNADIILFDPKRIRSIPMHDPIASLTYSSSADNIDTTIVNGEVVYSKGAFSCDIDEAQLARQVMTEMQDYSYL